MISIHFFHTTKANGFHSPPSSSISDNDEKKLKLGCIAIPYGQSACEAVRTELNIEATDDSDECLACQADLCNGSAIAKLSVLALLSVLLAKFLF